MCLRELKGMENMEETTTQQKNQNENEEIKEMGQLTLDQGKSRHKIHLLSIIGEIEGHESLAPNTKTTKYEHVLPKLASIEDDGNIDGVLVIINTVGGDVESGLAIAEMLSSLSKPTATPPLHRRYLCNGGVPLNHLSYRISIPPSGTYTALHSGTWTHSRNNRLPLPGLPSGSTGVSYRRKSVWSS